MLQYIYLENFAIINKLKLCFDKGFNTITGETGAGKSIIIDAVSIACGERCGTSVIGQYGDVVKIELCFNLVDYPHIKDCLKDYITDNKIVIYREIHKNGRNVYKINGNSYIGQTIKNISEFLIDVYGQHDNQKLFSPTYHLELIDNLSNDVEICKKEYINLYNEYKEKEQNLKYLKENQYEIKRNIDLYVYEINEIDLANLRAGEEEELEKEYEKLQNIENITSLLSEVYGTITSDFGAETIIGDISKNINQAYSFDKNLENQFNLINDISLNLNELSSSVNDYLEEIKDNDFDFETVANRLDLIKSLKKKYSMSVEEILLYRQKIGKNLDLYTSSEFNTETLEKELSENYENLKKSAEKLSENRKKVACDFEQSIIENLKDLGMPNCKFEVDFKKIEPCSKGIDDIEFLISPNPGMPVMSLRKIASGGELSRISLAIIIKRLKNPVPLMIFDEIDAGVGGVTGDKLGDKLKDISKLSQVICITHLPQIAAKSIKQFNVSKSELLNETLVSVNDLSVDERVKVIASMFGNIKSITSLSHAQELLRVNGNLK